MSSTFVRVPPQSTGKRISTTARYPLKFDNLSGNFTRGQTISGAGSGATGIITAVDTDGFGTTEGILWLKDVAGTFVNDENIQVESVTQAVTDITGSYPFEEYDYQNIVISDPDNPTLRQRIDRFGATINTFTDGSPSFGPFGDLTVGENQSIKDYRFIFDDTPEIFTDEVVGSANVEFSTLAGSLIFSTGTSSGDSIKRTSNFYHPYSPGVGQVVEMTVATGDTGKTGCVRRWGYFDDNNGAFFELDGTTLNFVVRNNVSGTITERRFPQTTWSFDPLDGSDNIGFVLDVTAANIYFIDMQWLGAGRIRFGVVEPIGSRITSEIIENANDPSVTFPYMKTATLPIRWEQTNTGNTGSTSEFRAVCAAVKHTSKVTISGKKHTEFSGVKTISDSDGEVPIIAVRPKITVNGIDNHAIVKGISTSYANLSSGSAVKFNIRTGTDAALTGSSWTSHKPGSILEYDISSSAINTSLTHDTHSSFVAPNATENIQDNSDRDTHSFEIYNSADLTIQPMFVITAEVLASNTSCDVAVSVNWEEIIL